MREIMNKLWERVVNSVVDSRVVKSQWGASAVEYALLAAAISVGILGAVYALRDRIGRALNSIRLW